MRSTPTGLSIADYVFSTQLDVRLTDLDFAKHVNNAAVAAFHEEVRVRFHLRYFGSEAVFNRRVGGGVIAHVSIQYLREIRYGTPIVGCAGIARLGNSSYTMRQALYQHDQCASEASCVIAQRDNGQADPLSASLRESLSQLIVPAESGSRP